MNPVDRDPELNAAGVPDAGPDSLDRLLAELRVPVREDFSAQVMSRLPEPSRHAVRSSTREWSIAAGLAIALVLIAALLLAGGDGAEDGVAGSVLDLVVATLPAGAGFLAASWRGVGDAVDAALGDSVIAMLALGLAALAANGLLLLLLRRRRRAAARARDDVN